VGVQQVVRDAESSRQNEQRGRAHQAFFAGAGNRDDLLIQCNRPVPLAGSFCQVCCKFEGQDPARRRIVRFEPLDAVAWAAEALVEQRQIFEVCGAGVPALDLVACCREQRLVRLQAGCQAQHALPGVLASGALCEIQPLLQGFGRTA
jgi:hypothetical protein